MLCLPGLPAYAYTLIEVEPVEAYSTIPIEGDPYVKRMYLGDLEDAPDLYELKTDVSMELTLQVVQRNHKAAVPFGLIVVRQNEENGGVEEVVRQNQSLESWQSTKNISLGISLLTTPTITTEIKPGTYRIEVSTPDNKGAYGLIVGEEPVRLRYTDTLRAVFPTQQHFGYTPFRILFSPYMLITLMVIGVMLFGVWRQYKKRSV
jgi:hypothetical protein